MAKRRRRRKALPEGLFDATIDSLSHDGRGIAHIDGKVTFIDAALPGETVRFAYTYQRKQFDEGRAEEVLEASGDRVEPPCEHAQLCGGCSLQHMSSDAQVRYKQDALKEQFTHLAGLDIPELLEPLRSPVLGYRRKARLAVKYVAKKGKVLVGFREKRNSFIADIQQCETLIPEVGHRLRDIASMIESLEARSHIPQIEVAKGDDASVALIFRHLEPLAAADIQTLQTFCRQHQFHLYLQASGPESIVRLPLEQLGEALGSEGSETLPESEMRLHYELPSQGLRYAFHPSDFTQVNGELNRLMIDRVLALMELKPDDTVLDLFCGLGNFSLAIARSVAHLVGVEGSEQMVLRARENAMANQLDNTAFYAINLDQPFVELAKANPDWLKPEYNKMLIDPPRSGAKAVVEAIHLFHSLQVLVYVSCNPATLARDAGILKSQGFELESAGVMDMFPHTNHVESIAVFRKA